jgi:hypothetical protein
MRAKISGGKARMSQQQHLSYLQQERESRDAYSDRLLAWHRQSYPVHVGPCRYARATTPFRAEDVLTHIANCARHLTEDLTVWLEDLSERYPYEWAEVLAPVRRKGGPSLNPAPIPCVEVVLKLGLGWSFGSRSSGLLGVGWLGDSSGVYASGSGRCNAGCTTLWGLLPRNNCGFKVLPRNNCGFKVLLKKGNYNMVEFA